MHIVLIPFHLQKIPIICLFPSDFMEIIEEISKSIIDASTTLTGDKLVSLENAIETADSMKSRGYGLKGRTTFSIYRFEDRDKYTLVWFVFCFLYILAGVIVSAFGFRYFPDIRYSAFDITTIPFYVVYLGKINQTFNRI